MEEEKKNSKLYVVIIILSVLVLGLGGYIIYDKVISKPKAPEIQNNNEDNTKFGKWGKDWGESGTGSGKPNQVEKIEWSDGKNNQEVLLNNKILELKIVKEGDNNEILYINDTKIGDILEWREIYSTGNLLFLGGSDICGTILTKAINEDGKALNIIKEYNESNGDNGGEYYLDGNSIKIDNGKLIAEIGHTSDCRCEAPDDSCEKSYQGKEKVEFVYNGENVTIKKVVN